MANEGGVFVATESFSTVDESGAPLIVHKGATRVRDGHFLVRTYPHYFENADTNVQYDVEEATAVPGERRGERGKPGPKPGQKVSKQVAPARGETTAEQEDRGSKQPVRGSKPPSIAVKDGEETKS